MIQLSHQHLFYTAELALLWRSELFPVWGKSFWVLLMPLREGTGELRAWPHDSTLWVLLTDSLWDIQNAAPSDFYEFPHLVLTNLWVHNLIPIIRRPEVWGTNLLNGIQLVSDIKNQGLCFLLVEQDCECHIISTAMLCTLKTFYSGQQDDSYSKDPMTSVTSLGPGWRRGNQLLQVVLWSPYTCAHTHM